MHFFLTSFCLPSIQLLAKWDLIHIKPTYLLQPGWWPFLSRGTFVWPGCFQDRRIWVEGLFLWKVDYYFLQVLRKAERGGGRWGRGTLKTAHSREAIALDRFLILENKSGREGGWVTTCPDFLRTDWVSRNSDVQTTLNKKEVGKVKTLGPEIWKWVTPSLTKGFKSPSLCVLENTSSLFTICPPYLMATGHWGQEPVRNPHTIGASSC